MRLVYLCTAKTRLSIVEVPQARSPLIGESIYNIKCRIFRILLSTDRRDRGGNSKIICYIQLFLGTTSFQYGPLGKLYPNSYSPYIKRKDFPRVVPISASQANADRWVPVGCPLPPKP